MKNSELRELVDQFDGTLTLSGKYAPYVDFHSLSQADFFKSAYDGEMTTEGLPCGERIYLNSADIEEGKAPKAPLTEYEKWSRSIRSKEWIDNNGY